MQPTNPPVRAKKHQYLHVLQLWAHLQAPGFSPHTGICTHTPLPSSCGSCPVNLSSPASGESPMSYKPLLITNISLWIAVLQSKTDSSLVNHQNNNKNNNVLTCNEPSKCIEGCGKRRVVFACHRLLLKTKKWLIQMKVLGVETELEIVMTGLGGRRSIFWLLCRDIQSMCRV